MLLHIHSNRFLRNHTAKMKRVFFLNHKRLTKMKINVQCSLFF